MLLGKIELFSDSLTTDEAEIFKEFFKKSYDEHSIAAIKLLPKVHKLSTEPNLENLFEIPSRIVRGGETCPLNSHSKCLKVMISNMINELKSNFYVICNSDHKFPLITGCEQYFDFINNVEMNSEGFFNVMLITSDFKDAFTNATLAQLINAIHKAGTWLKSDRNLIKLMIKLARLVIPLCTFHVPQGIMISKDGYPIGGHSSCECLNLNLLICEFKTLIHLTENDNCLLSACRLVDDVSFIFRGSFKEIISTLQKFIDNYPPMELNVQFSPRLSNFLDYKIYNTFFTANKLTTVMARKKLNTYAYVRPDSNCPPCHKGCVVESTLHRIFRRSNNKDDRTIQVLYTRALMASKGYEDRVFCTKFKKFMAKRKSGVNKNKNSKDYIKRIRASIPFDGVSNSHLFINKILKPITKQFEIGNAVTVPKSKLIDLIASKRQIIGKMAEIMGFTNTMKKRSKICPYTCKLCDD